jgi:hypothetical protein
MMASSQSTSIHGAPEVLDLANNATHRNASAMSKLKEEFFALLPSTIFFFVALHILAFVRVLMLKGTGISPFGSVSIGVAALILGKAVLSKGPVRGGEECF